tara:strand:+ start:71 stop:760 length:690 start_codon:yes stop_codon:yes gene_type:complete
MERKKEFKKIGFIFGLKKEMKLVSSTNNNKFCVYGYGKSSKEATKELLKLGVDMVVNFGFAGSVSKSLKNGDIVFVNRILNERNNKLTPSKFNQDFIKNLEKKIKFVKCNLLTVQKIVGDKKAKLKLVKKFESISVIDMEAYYIKEELLKANIPMASFKVIFDDLSFGIPSYITECINKKGELKKIKFLMKLILNPKRIFDLLEVNAKFSKSKKVLESLVNSFNVSKTY